MNPDLGRKRLFLAIALDQQTTDLLGAHLSANGLESWPGRVVPPENWHVTLRFLGWTSDVQRDQILRSLDERPLGIPFRIRFGGLGGFPKAQRATVTWLAVNAGADELSDLATACDDAAQAAGFEAESRPFHAHLTLSRVRPPVDLRDRIAAFDPFDVALRVNAITLFESQLSPGGARYEAVDRIPLARGRSTLRQ